MRFQQLRGALNSHISVQAAKAASAPRAHTMAQKIRIDVISDSVCPWCYVGKSRIEKAMKQFKGEKEFELHWHPFQLNPSAPSEGVNKREMYQQKFGSRASQIMETMTATYAKEGLPPYNMDGLTGNTLNSHRLIHYAGKQGSDKQNALVEELFKAYFTEGKFINDPDVLKAAAKTARIEGGDKVVDDPSIARDEVVKELQQRRYEAVSGVPHFVIDNKYELSGAQDPSTFVEVFKRL